MFSIMPKHIRCTNYTHLWHFNMCSNNNSNKVNSNIYWYPNGIGSKEMRDVMRYIFAGRSLAQHVCVFFYIFVGGYCCAKAIN